MGNFETALSEVLKEEGGWSDHPKDPGGATMRGVTQRTYDDFRKRRGLAIRSVREIENSELLAIYKASYWDLSKCDQLPPGVDYVVFDGDVNSGVKQSVKWLQRALGVKDDGIIGPTTISAAHAFKDPGLLIDRICDARLAFLKSLKTWSTFGRGWQSRVGRVRARGKAMAHGAAIPVHVQEVVIAPTPKARIEDIKKAPSAALGDALAGAGTMGAVLTQAAQQLTPFTQIEFVAKVVAVLTGVSALLAVVGIAYGLYARNRKAEIKDATQVGTA